jgi:GNAT superfamily N-acetyltransferase
MRSRFAPPEAIQPWHELGDFSCGEAPLDAWLRTRALKNELSGASRTYVLAEGARVIGYYSLAVGGAGHSLVSAAMRRDMPQPIPVMLLARLAVDAQAQGRGLGKALVRDALLRTLQAADIAGIRAVLAHALHDKAAAFYRSCGFLPSPVDSRALMLGMRQIAAALRD